MDRACCATPYPEAVRTPRGSERSLRGACSRRALANCWSGCAPPDRMLPLHGIGVLVTRPRQQAAALCRLLEAQGGRVERFTGCEAEPISARREWLGKIGAQH